MGFCWGESALFGPMRIHSPDPAIGRGTCADAPCVDRIADSCDPTETVCEKRHAETVASQNSQNASHRVALKHTACEELEIVP